MIFATCDFCGGKFREIPSHYSKTKNHYCGRSCYWNSKITSVSRFCKHCGVSFKVKKSICEKGSGLFCSDICRRTYQAENKMSRKEINRRYSNSEKGKLYSRIWHRIKAYWCDPTLDTDFCFACQSKDNLVVHHKDGKNGRNGKTLNNARDNLVVLCRRCHPRFHSRWGLKEVVSYEV